MASPQSAYVTAVPDDYDVEQASSPSDSETSASATANMDFDPSTWPDFNHTSPFTISSSPPQSSTWSDFDRTSHPQSTHQNSPNPQPQSPHTRSKSLSQKWHQIITSTSCPASLSANPNSLNEITRELSQRDFVDSRLWEMRSKQAHDEEQRRRLKWAMEMILTRPEESAEVCAALRKVR